MAVASNLMAEVTRDYELCMSALVFDSNMMNEANIQVGGRGRSWKQIMEHCRFHAQIDSNEATDSS